MADFGGSKTCICFMADLGGSKTCICFMVDFGGSAEGVLLDLSITDHLVGWRLMVNSTSKDNKVSP